jgi:hypothetical protein
MMPRAHPNKQSIVAYSIIYNLKPVLAERTQLAGGKRDELSYPLASADVFEQEPPDRQLFKRFASATDRANGSKKKRSSHPVLPPPRP